MRSIIRRSVATAGVLAFALLGAACGSDSGSSAGSGGTTTTTAAAAPTTTTTTSAAMDPAGMVGPGCAAYAQANPSGAGSVAGMAADPVAVAASNNPLLKTLVAAVSGKLNPQVNLVDTLNGGQFTVFAPIDDAFAKIPAATVETLKTDKDLLTKILTYHVVPNQIAPDKIAGEQTTVQGGKVTVSGAGNALKVNDANVVCGGVRTANATVYLIDTVLMPTM